MKNILLILILLLTVDAFSQNIMVPTINYNSPTRDTMIQFPDVDHNEYEKIILHYSMRCKDGLVSTGAERNKGCGEWDYSCNTYIVDESKVDSFKQTAPQFDFVGRGDDVLEYTDEQTYTTRQISHISVEYLNVIFDRGYNVVEGSEDIDNGFGLPGAGSIIEYILTADQLLDAGVNPNNDITGIEIPLTSGDILFKNMKVFIQQTASAEINSTIGDDDWTEVLHNDTKIDGSDKLLKFYEKYEWDGTSNLAFRISYDAAEGSGIELQGAEIGQDAAAVSDLNNDQYWTFGTSGHIEIDGDFSSIEDEMTIAFWQYGFHTMPINSSIIEAVDENNRRQVNAHLPWGNGSVFWDCGNEGTYDRISKAALDTEYKNQWNHWAFTKNATTGEMHIYLNGALWQEGLDKHNKISIDRFKIGQNIAGNNIYRGRIDEFQIYNKALEGATISEWMHSRVTSQHPNFSDILVYYDFDSPANATLEDKSGNGNKGTLEGLLYNLPQSVDQALVSKATSSSIFNQIIKQDLVVLISEETISTYQYPNLPQRVDEYLVSGTDLEFVNSEYYYNIDDSVLLDTEGSLISSDNIPSTGSIDAGSLEYYSKRAMEYELMSFVTPYGIGIDFGLEGHTWTFDVSHLGPILKGNKRMYLTRGGQNQEEMDIRFEYVKGTPDRDIIDVQNIWPTTGRVSFNNIRDNVRFEPRQFTYDSTVATYMIKTAITGHGQEGEFIPRIHTMTVGNFGDSWSVWKECAENPIYPQGGTWVYDRAGWCPGMATDIRDWNVTEFFQFYGTPEVDYDLPFATGTSDYIISSQLVSYGAANKTLDLAIEDVVYPSSRIEHARFNPTCLPPVITIKNHGSENITNAVIEYGVIGKSKDTYTWNGNISFLGQETFELGFLARLSVIEEGDMFFARILNVNGQADTYSNNDEYITELEAQDHYDGDLIIEMRTNNAANETSLRVFDSNENQLVYRGGNLSANSTYIDTLKGLTGCYKIAIEDSGEDGISWWANNDGDGYIRVREDGGAWKTIATDFGASVDYVFTIGNVTDTEEVLRDEALNLYPNPGNGIAYIENMKAWDPEVNVAITDQLGRTIQSHSVPTQKLLDDGIALTDHPVGLYIIRISDSKRKSIIKYIRMSSN